MAEVRRYRRLMASAESAFLRLGLDDESATAIRRRIVDGLPRWDLAAPARHGHRGGLACRVATAPLAGRPGLRQRWHWALADGARPPDALRVAFGGRLDRPALAMVTEVSPSPPTGATTTLRALGRQLEVEAAALPARAVVSVRIAGTEGADGASSGWRLLSSSGSLPTAELVVPWPAGAHRLLLTLEVEFEAPPGTPDSAPATVRSLRARPTVRSGTLVAPLRLRPRLDRLARRAVDYVLGCTALRTAPDCRVILTDHRLLPLSWTRDAYWQALLLLAAEAAGMLAEGDGASVVGDHLRWLFWRAERRRGAWSRSHHADGRIKDHRFQVDQQLYPLLELADLWRATGRLPDPPADAAAGGGDPWPGLVAEAWAAVQQAATGPDGLLRTDENAADDPAPQPYLLSNQVLGWYTARRLEPLAAWLGLHGLGLAKAADHWQSAVRRRFALDPSAGGPAWASAIDDEGTTSRYHDANELPTALAPLWGFCAPDDRAWRATLRFAFGPANEAHVTGAFGGLGSRHTPGTWPLGDIQGWVAASLAGDAVEAAARVARLVGVATADGLLPETYEAGTGTVGSRHWFAWPGAALGALWLLERSGSLARRLGPTEE